MRGRLVTSGQAYYKLVLKRGDFSKVFDYREVVSSRGNGVKKGNERHWGMFMKHPVDPCLDICIREECKLWKAGAKLLSGLFMLKLWVWNCTKFCKGKEQNSISTCNRETWPSLGAQGRLPCVYFWAIWATSFTSSSCQML